MASGDGKQLLILGCGYVGSAVAAWGRQEGWRVTALTRNAVTAAGLRDLGVQAVVADLAGDEWHAAVPAAPELTVNCVSSGGGGLEAYVRSYQRGMESVVRWRESRGQAGTLVYTGSTSVYAQGGGVAVHEGLPAEGGTDRSQVLLAAEALVLGSGAGWSRRFVLRLAGIYGPGRTHLLEQVRAGEIAGRGEHHLNLIHREDIVGAIAACSRSTGVAGGIFNVVDDAPTRRAEVAAWLAERLGAPSPRFTGEPHPGRRMVTPDRRIQNARLREELGWRPRFPTFREGYATLLSP